MIRNFDELIEMLRSQPVRRRVAVVMAQDEHTMEAVLRAWRDGLVEPVLIGDRDQIRQVLKNLDAAEAELEVVHIEDAVEAAEEACRMAKAGEIDCIMKGKLETGTLMKVLVNREKGIRNSEVMSLMAFMESPGYHKIFAISDPALLTYPNREQKMGAIRNCVGAFRKIGIDHPKVAILAAVEKMNPKMPETVDAAEIKEAGIEGAVIEGPISLDLAMDAQSAGIKGYESPVAGDADLLVTPDIVSANLLAKGITVLGGGRTGGTVLGALVPVLLVSRAATADDKYMSIVVSALVGGKG